MTVDSGQRVSSAPGSTQQFVTDLLDWALFYSAGDFPIFPLHSPKKIGLCDCPGGVQCDSPAKHPRTLKGFKDASCDEDVVKRWWKMWPRANIGLSVPTGYVVLDIDGDEGIVALREHGFWLPETPQATTGKGWHYWFKTRTDLPPRAHMLPKVDLRGPGSYVVAPPSLHISGVQYRWEHSFVDTEFQYVPDWLIELASHSSGISFATGDRPYLATDRLFSEGIPDGERDVTLFRVASKLRAIGIPQDVAEGVICALAERCRPAFDVDDAMRKVASAYGRYSAGTWAPFEDEADTRTAEWQNPNVPYDLPKDSE